METVAPISFRFWRRRLRNSRFWPRTKLARLTALMAGLWGAFWLLKSLLRGLGWEGGAGAAQGWALFFEISAISLFLILLLRAARRRVMWRLRNRLVVTYIFIGVIPVLLIAVMALGAGLLFAGQLAAYLVTSDLNSEVKSLQAVNSAVAADVGDALRQRGKVSGSSLAQSATLHGSALPRVRTQVWLDGKLLPNSKQPASDIQGFELPSWTNGKFGGVALDADQQLYLRASEQIDLNGQKLMVASSMPLDATTLNGIVGSFAEATIYRTNMRVVVGGKVKRVGVPGASNRSDSSKENEKPVANSPLSVRGGTFSQPAGVLNRSIQFVTFLPTKDWISGTEWSLLTQVRTNIAALYGRLFSTSTDWADIIRNALIGFALLFGVIELFALFIGLGLTRTITRSVAALYVGTQRVNRGDFSHRIAVKSNDQLAALESSFNSMSENLQKLIAEQKEKQRLESELAIAQEVQGQLFPRGDTQLPSLELHGVCRPARTVSGDYYDFLELGDEKLALAVGDISGKGISAALLMATIHSAVRVYQMGDTSSRRALIEAEAASLRTAAGGTVVSTMVAETQNGSMPSPRHVLWMLNRHLLRSTPAEKYATLFLARYEGATRTLTYSNGGHLPPVVMRASGRIEKLSEGGTVIGLLENVRYEEGSITLARGDTFLAYSDGLTEPENEFGEFGERRLLELANEHRHLPLDRLSETVISAVQDWIGASEQPDDMTLVLARAR